MLEHITETNTSSLEFALFEKKLCFEMKYFCFPKTELSFLAK